MRRLPDSPTRIALGFACGVYTSFTPFFGFHFVISAALAWVLRGNIFASAIGTFFGNPLTFPFIAGVSLELGGRIMSSPIQTDLSGLSFHEMAVVIVQNIFELMIPYFVGGLIPGLICAVISYFLIHPIVATYQKRRRVKLMARAKARIEAQNASDSEAAKPGPGKAASDKGAGLSMTKPPSETRRAS